MIFCFRCEHTGTTGNEINQLITAPDFIDKLGYGFTVSPVPADIEDGFILKYGDIEVNCTFAALFRAYSQELQAKANELLFK